LKIEYWWKSLRSAVFCTAIGDTGFGAAGVTDNLATIMKFYGRKNELDLLYKLGCNAKKYILEKRVFFI